MTSGPRALAALLAVFVGLVALPDLHGASGLHGNAAPGGAGAAQWASHGPDGAGSLDEICPLCLAGGQARKAPSGARSDAGLPPAPAPWHAHGAPPGSVAASLDSRAAPRAPPIRF